MLADVFENKDNNFTLKIVPIEMITDYKFNETKSEVANSIINLLGELYFDIKLKNKIK